MRAKKEFHWGQKRLTYFERKRVYSTSEVPVITTTRCSVVYRYLSRFFLVLCRIANDLENEKSGLYKTTCTLITPFVEGYLTRSLIEREVAIEFAWRGCCDSRTWVCVNVLVCASMGLFVWPWQWISEFYFQTLVWVSEWECDIMATALCRV